MKAFRAAVDEGADMSELDVWLSADGVPMVHHDEAVGSPARPIGSLRRAELASNTATALIPALGDVLAWARGRMGVYIELKGPESAEPVAALVRRHEMARHVVIGSFQTSLVAAVRAADPGLITSILSHTPDVDALIELGRSLGVDYLHPCWKRAVPRPHTLLTAAVVRRVSDAGMGVVTWDEDRPEELGPLFAAAPDAVSTNMPARAAAIRDERLRPGGGDST